MHPEHLGKYLIFSAVFSSFCYHASLVWYLNSKAVVDEKFRIPVREGYGQTETCAIACNIPGMEVRPGSMGKFTPGVEGTIVDSGTGERVPVGKKGIIAVVRDHPMLFKGYHKKETTLIIRYFGKISMLQRMTNQPTRRIIV
ncbi:MAG: AMP-binding protein [Methanosarcinales archaeon]